MSIGVCTINPPGHDWENGLTCRWCQATRTVTEAIQSQLSSRRGGDPTSAQKLLDAFRAEVLAEADLQPKADVVAWLVKKAREGTPVEVLASEVDRGAVRPDNLRMLPADFFEPGHTYARQHHASTIRFLVQHVDWSPCGTYRIAFGWRIEDGDVTWSPTDSDDFGGWGDVTEDGAR